MQAHTNKRIFLTGATGFLGSHLCAALLKEGHQITALVRASPRQNSRDRVVKILERVSQGQIDSSEGINSLEVIEGDIAIPNFGLDSETTSRLRSSTDEVWHSAASLSFLEEDRESIFHTNLNGTKNIVEWTASTTGKRLQHVSTAYVAGKRTTDAREIEVDVEQGFKNPYEESKCLSESLVHTAHRNSELTASVYRPSIVIGQSGSGYATHFHGVYAFIRGLWSAIERLRRRQSADFVELPLRILGSETSTLNFVPVDYVTDAMLAIASQRRSEGGIYHLANPIPTENKVWMQIVCDQLRVAGIELVNQQAFEEKPMTKLEALFQRQMSFYYQYLTSEPPFDCQNTLEALAGTPITCPIITPEFARKMTGWYIDMLNDKNSEQ